MNPFNAFIAAFASAVFDMCYMKHSQMPSLHTSAQVKMSTINTNPHTQNNMQNKTSLFS